MTSRNPIHPLHRTAVTGVTYVKEKPDLILMHDDNTIAVLDKEKDMPEPSAKVGTIAV